MSGNTFGKILKITSFGESHGKAIGGVIEGFPCDSPKLVIFKIFPKVFPDISKFIT